ncbi:MAG: hypothetical protein C0484_20095 [Rhodospirillum sp.]|nr:hypothetical protein [Rhodospirillum sp.]
MSRAARKFASKEADRDPKTAIRPKRSEPFDGAAPPTGDDEPPRFSRIYAGSFGPDAGGAGHENMIATVSW